jgi:transcriptional regulator with GAF, ATPase, and Fis domain
MLVITQNENMRAILARISTIAASDSSVLLIGETGVGKELFADHIHRSSPRSDKPFVKIALSAMPHDLLESELFGHEKGAFTNATNEKKGCSNSRTPALCFSTTSMMCLNPFRPSFCACSNRAR